VTSGEVANSPFQNVLQRFVGAKDHPPLEIRFETTLPGDTYVLSTDGLHDRLDIREMAALIKIHGTPELAARALVALANEKGGDDDITVIVVQVAQPALAEAVLP
jgi:protein phosphatase